MRLLTLLGLFFGQASFAAQTDIMEFRELCARLEVVSEVFIYDQQGHLVEKKREFQKLSNNTPWSSIDPEKTCKIEAGWGSQWDKDQPVLSLKFGLEVKKDLSLMLNVAQYEEGGEEAGHSDPILKKSFNVTDLQTVTWQSPLHKEQKVMVRFIPNLSFREEPQDLTKLAISARDAMFLDQEGQLWAKDMNFKGQYIAVITHKGGVAFSFYKFPGSSLIGEARGKTIKLRDNNGYDLTLTGASNLLPDGQASRVYGLFTSKTTSGPGSTHGYSSSDEKEIIEVIKRDF